MSAAPLPGVLAEIAEIAGREAAIALALEWGGREIHIPKPEHLTRNPQHPLARLLNFGRAVRIAQRFAGEKIYIPQARAACALHLAAKGIPAGAIAARLRISPRTVRRIIAAG